VEVVPGREERGKLNIEPKVQPALQTVRRKTNPLSIRVPYATLKRTEEGLLREIVDLRSSE